MKPALQAIIQFRAHCSRDGGILRMPHRFGPFRSGFPRRSGFAYILVAAAAACLVGPAEADCITQPNQQAPDGAHWSLHLDHATNRRCWILVDAAGRDVVVAQPEQTTVSSFQSFLGNFTRSFVAPPSQQEAPAPSAPRRPSNVDTASRSPPRTEQKGEAHSARQRELSPEARDALYNEFLRWQESQQMTGAKPPSH